MLMSMPRADRGIAVGGDEKRVPRQPVPVSVTNQRKR
jgi:hypothetical protein